jgi:hypothetical protein
MSLCSLIFSRKKSRLLSPAHTNGVQSYSSGRLEQAPNRYDQRALRWGGVVGIWQTCQTTTESC